MLLDPHTGIALAGVFGLIVGSFLNVVIHRLPRIMEREWAVQCAEFLGNTPPAQAEPFNLAVPRSRCPHCGHAIGALENIPVLSYLALGGKCRACRQPISARYPAVELLTGGLFALAALTFGLTPAGAAAMLFIAAAIALAFIDYDTQLLPDDINQPLLWAGLVVNLFATYTALGNALIGAIAGYLSLWTVYWAFKLLTGKEGMGYGDFKLLAAIGAWLGWQMLPLVILLSSLVGAVVGGGLMVFAKRGRDVPMPFGPFLAAAGVIGLFCGKSLNAYLFSVS